MFEIATGNFNYSELDVGTADFLKERDQAIKDIAEDTYFRFGRELKKAQDRLGNNRNGIFQKWYSSKGLTKDNVYYCINLYLSSRNLDNKQRETFLNAPKSLQVETMKKKTPEEVRKKVFNGEITTHKEFKDISKTFSLPETSKDTALKVYLDLMKDVQEDMKNYSTNHSDLEDDESFEKFDDVSYKILELVVHLKTFLFADSELDESVKDEFKLMLGTALKGEMSLKFSPLDWENLEEMRMNQIKTINKLISVEESK